MFYPEAQVAGSWDIGENEKGNTVVDVKALQAEVPNDLTPIYTFGGDLPIYSTQLQTEVVDIEGTKCDMRLKLCRLNQQDDYEHGLCQHKTYAVQVLRDWDSYTLKELREEDRENLFSYAYSEFRKELLGVGESHSPYLKNKMKLKTYGYPRYELNIHVPLEVITLEKLRNAGAYLDLQKELPRIREYDGFTKLDWDSLYNLLRQYHLDKYPWYKKLNVHNLTDVSKVILAQKITQAILSDDDDAIVNLYYELINSVFEVNILYEFIRQSDYGKDSILIPHTDVATGEIQRIALQEYVLAYSAIAYEKTKMVYRDKIDDLEYLLSQGYKAKYHLRDGMFRYKKITTGRYKQAARILSGGADYIRSASKKTSSVTGMRNFDSLSKFMDDKTARKVAEKAKAKTDAKAEFDFRMFKAKHSTSSSYVIPGDGGIPSKSHGRRGNYRWGDLAVIQEPLTQNLKHKIKGATHKPNEYGVIPHYTDRYFSDKRMFRVKKNIRGGTVLIDASGSMSLSEDDIMSIIEALPAGLVAMYSGTSDKRRVNARGGGDGELCILAKNQRMVSKLPASLVENIVDYPALVWLSKMPKPRIWVSDQQVTMLYKYGAGYSEEVSRAGTEQCLDLVKKAGIVTLSDITDVIDFAKSVKRL
jgi:hypothetical protein